MSDGAAVSSTRVRKALGEGMMDRAAGLLGRWFTITGRVVEGAGRGRELGHPTANLEPVEPVKGIFPHGIYAAMVDMDGTMMQGAFHYGPRPTYDEDEPTLELNLFDFKGDLYGRTLEVAVIERLRPILTFDSSEALVAQMDEDDRNIKEIFARIGSKSDPLSWAI
jgi:riboflavin kinase/FMN adenylyltransferase